MTVVAPATLSLPFTLLVRVALHEAARKARSMFRKLSEVVTRALDSITAALSGAPVLEPYEVVNSKDGRNYVVLNRVDGIEYSFANFSSAVYVRDSLEAGHMHPRLFVSKPLGTYSGVTA